jgi:hydrogenase nickel incorporation protein HypA/HybF
MHEWALAESIISTAIQFADKENLKNIYEINIKIGELQQVERDILRFALKEITRSEDRLKKVRINIKTEKSLLRCKSCENEWTFRDLKLKEEELEAIHFLPEVAFAYMRCKKCRSPDFEIVRGRGVSITSIRGENG